MKRFYLPSPSAAANSAQLVETQDLLDRIDNSYLALVSRRASDALQTGHARWIRALIDAHPDYAHHSVIGEQVAYDMTRSIDQLMRDAIWSKELFGDIQSHLCRSRLSSSQ